MAGELHVKNRRTEPWYDNKIGAMITIPSEHMHTHEGETYILTYLIPHGSELANDGTAVLGFETGDKDIHAIWEVTVEGTSHLLFKEGATITGGSSLTPKNKNRNGDDDDTTVTVTLAPTISVAGTALASYMAGSGKPSQGGGGAAGGRDEWVLKPNTTYTVELINRSGGAILGGFSFEWYEEE